MDHLTGNPRPTKKLKTAHAFAPVVMPLPMPLPPPAPVIAPPSVFNITCLYIGQGDCFLIQCPDGRFVMIDCGSTFTKVNDNVVIQQLQLLLPLGIIDTLIITHSDADHHNKVELLSRANITVNNLVVGNLEWPDVHFKILASGTIAAADYSATRASCQARIPNPATNTADYINMWKRKYPSGGRSSLDMLLNNCGVTKLVGVTLNSNRNTVEPVPPNIPVFYGNVKNFTRTPGAQNFVYQDQTGSIVNGVLPLYQDANWGVKIIAAQVEAGINEGEKTVYMNAASLVTVLEAGNFKAIFTGDSTGATFRYLLNDFPQGNAYFPPAAPAAGPFLYSLLQVPHHGSDTHGTNDLLFVQRTKPQHVITSVKFRNGFHRLPKWTTLANWKQKGFTILDTAATKDHYIGYWITKNELLNKRINIQFGNFLLNNAGNNGYFIQFPPAQPPLLSNQHALFSLKPGVASARTNADSSSNLLLLGSKKAVTRGGNIDYYFVIQKTRKSIATNGSNQLNAYLTGRIPGPGNYVIVSDDELFNNVFNLVSATRFTLSNTTGITKF